MRFRSEFSLFVALVLSCVSLFGQTVASSPVGTVVDSSTAVIGGAAVTLTSADTGAAGQQKLRLRAGVIGPVVAGVHRPVSALLRVPA